MVLWWYLWSRKWLCTKLLKTHTNHWHLHFCHFSFNFVQRHFLNLDKIMSRGCVADLDQFCAKVITLGLFTWRWETPERWENMWRVMRDYTDRRVAPPKRVTSPTWCHPPPSYKQALSATFTYTWNAPVKLWRKISYLPVGICYCFKAEKHKKNFSKEMQRLQMNPPCECGLIDVIHSNLAVFLFHFSKTTLLQLDVFKNW